MTRTTSILRWLIASLTGLILASPAPGGVVTQVRDAAGGETSSGHAGGFFVAGTGSTIRATFNGATWKSYSVGVDDFEYQITASFDPLRAFCFEPTQVLRFGTNPSDTTGQGYTLAPLAGDATATSTQKDYASRLWANAYALTAANKVNAAAFQSVLWEVLLDSNPSLTAGNFRLSGEDSFTLSVRTTAQQWLNNLGNNTWTASTSLFLFRSGVSQDLITNAPEPGTIALLAIAGLLMLAKRRKV